MVLHIYMHGKEVPDDQYSCIGGVDSQPVFLGGSGSWNCKDLDVAKKI